MKRVLLTLLVLAIAAPAMADVTISIVDNGDLTADIIAVADGTDADAGSSLVAGIALDVSVDVGTIDAAVAAKEGISTAAAPGFGIFMGTITFDVVGEETVILAAGSPVAPADAPDAPGQLGTSAIVLELGALYDVAVAADAPLATTTLATITVSEGCEVTLAANGTRGGVVLIGGGDPSALTIIGGPIAPVTGGLYKGPDQAEWDLVGQPDSWATDRQCHGDADNSDEVIQKGTYWVGVNDIAILLAGFKQEYPNPAPADPDATHPWIAADFDHAAEVIQKGTYRVGVNDISILLGSFKSETVPTDCNQ